jgi:hypothetical protein
VGFVTLSGTGSALAHGSERGFVLLLPTDYYLTGGALAVAASFVLIALVPGGPVRRLAARRIRLGSLPALSPVPTSLLAFAVMVLLVGAGLYGSRDPLENPLPLAVWTVWWIGMTVLHAAFGNLWAFINPWSGPYRLVEQVFRGRIGRFAYPRWLGYWPAVLLFFAFAWMELVYPAPDDPERLAIAVACYWLIAFAGMLIFGEQVWAKRAEPFSIFFRLVAGLSPFILEQGAAGRARLALCWPGAALLEREPLPPSGVLFVLLTLSSVSFDGLSKTFWWLSLGGINPLEYPGRSAVVDRNTIGLLLAFAALSACYWAVVGLGWILARTRGALNPALGTLVYSIIPISIAFHFSHYLTALLVNGQYALIAASDPFGTGHDLLGLGHLHVTTSFLNTFGSVRLIWNLQTTIIVVGHIAGIVLAHLLALRHFGDGRRAALSQIPLAALMVLYTLFGLWLLSTPTAG